MKESIPLHPAGRNRLRFFAPDFPVPRPETAGFAGVDVPPGLDGLLGAQVFDVGVNEGIVPALAGMPRKGFAAAAVEFGGELALVPVVAEPLEESSLLECTSQICIKSGSLISSHPG